MTLKIISLLLIATGTGFSQPVWTRLPTPTSKGLVAVKFRTSTDGWAVGEKGTIVHTTDGGTSWQVDSAKYLGVGRFLSFVEPRESFNTWAGDWSSPTFRSTDAGATWTSLWIDSVANISRIFFVNSKLAFAAGVEITGEYRGRIFKSANGGASWSMVFEAQNRGFYDIYFVDSLLGIAVGAVAPTLDNFYPGTIYRTTDGGISWLEVDAPGSGPLEHIALWDTSKGWACGMNVHLLFTTDGGRSWMQKYFPLGGNGNLSSLAVPGPSDVWVAAALEDVVFHSTNDGST